MKGPIKDPPVSAWAQIYLCVGLVAGSLFFLYWGPVGSWLWISIVVAFATAICWAVQDIIRLRREARDKSNRTADR